MDFFSSIYEIGKNMWEASGKWFGYFNDLDANMKNLKRKTEELSNQGDDTNTQLSSEEQRPGKRRKKEVAGWLRDVQNTRDEVKRLEQRVAGERNFVSRVRLGKLVLEKIEEVAELQQKGRFSNGLVIDAPTARGRFIPKTSFSETTTRVPYEEDWSEDLERVSLMWNEMQVLPSRPPIYRHLPTLLLHDEVEVEDVDDDDEDSMGFHVNDYYYDDDDDDYYDDDDDEGDEEEVEEMDDDDEDDTGFHVNDYDDDEEEDDIDEEDVDVDDEDEDESTGFDVDDRDDDDEEE